MENLLPNKIDDKFTIRYAKKGDCKNLFKLIQELADYLDSSKEIAIGVEELEKYGFDCNHSLYKCLVVEERKDCSSIVGDCTDLSEGVLSDYNPLVAYALFSFSFSSWYGKGLYLEDIYISKTYRGKGLGTALLKRIAKVALESRCSNITLFVFKSNEMKDFFLSKGAENLTINNGFDYYKIDKKSLTKIANE